MHDALFYRNLAYLVILSCLCALYCYDAVSHMAEIFEKPIPKGKTHFLGWLVTLLIPYVFILITVVFIILTSESLALK